MISISKLRLFPYVTNSVRFPINEEEPYTLLIYNENASFERALSSLNIPRVFVKYVFLKNIRFPRYVITANIIKLLKTLSLIPIRNLEAAKNNAYFDFSPILDGLYERFGGEDTFKKDVALKTVIKHLESFNIEGRKTVFLYVQDKTKPVDVDIRKRRIWPILRTMLDKDQLPFDYFLMARINDSGPQYTLFKSPETSVSFVRIRAAILSTKWEESDTDTVVKKDEIIPPVEHTPESEHVSDEPYYPPSKSEKISGNIVKSLQDELSEDKKESIKTSLHTFASKYPQEVDDSKLQTKSSIYKIASKSILYSLTSDKAKVDRIIANISDDDSKDFFDRVQKNLATDIIPRTTVVNTSRDPIIKNVNVLKLVEGKEPSHVLNKRVKDFENTFDVDLKNAFNLLSKKDFPLTLKTVKKSIIQPEPGDLDPSIYDSYTITLVDENKQPHNVEIQIPHLMEDGTFLINGKKKYLIYQIILDPIFFLKDGTAKLETLYAPASIYWKRTKLKSYFSILIGGYRLPLFSLLAYHIGFDSTMKLFGITYKLTDSAPERDSKYFRLHDGYWIVFDSKSPESIELLNSLKEIPYLFTSTNFKEHKTYQQVMIKITGNRNCLFKLDEVLMNIMEPVSVQILKTKLLPYELPKIIHYMCYELVRGRIDDRNDLKYQRVRTSEIFAQQIQKLILGSYNEYRFKRISGDESAKYYMDATQTVKEIINSKLVRDLENINPTEELSCMTRITPTGEGGIPDANAITKASRNIHESYFGNIDAHDTPEGSFVPNSKVLVDHHKVKEIGNIEIGDSVLWKDGKLYTVKNKVRHNKKLMSIKTKYGILRCSPEHRFPAFDCVTNQEVLVNTNELYNNVGRYKLIKYSEDQI